MNMKLMTAAIAAALIASGCASSRQMQGPNGSTAYFIKCPSAAIDACYEEANKVCPFGYTFADKQASGSGMIIPAGNMAMMAKGPNTMLIECRAKAAPSIASQPEEKATEPK